MDTAFSKPFKVVHILQLCFSHAITLLQAVDVPKAAVSTLEVVFCFFFLIYETCWGEIEEEKEKNRDGKGCGQPRSVWL